MSALTEPGVDLQNAVSNAVCPETPGPELDGAYSSLAVNSGMEFPQACTDPHRGA